MLELRHEEWKSQVEAIALEVGGAESDYILKMYSDSACPLSWLFSDPRPAIRNPSIFPLTGWDQFRKLPLHLRHNR
jgi:hypothetical protein